MLATMTQHVTIALDEQELSRARELAEVLGVTVEEYLQRLVRGQLPLPPANAARPDITSNAGNGEPVASKPPRKLTGTIEDLFDLIPASEGLPTDIGRDKHEMVGEAVWQEHLRKTRQR